MLITIIGGAIVLVAATFISWPLLLGSAADTDALPGETPNKEAFLSLAKQRDNALSSLRDAEMDHETGKLSEMDYETIRNELETEAMEAIRKLDVLEGPSESGKDADFGFCPACGARRNETDTFCGQCGLQLPAITS
jgi:hypothetical protein